MELSEEKLDIIVDDLLVELAGALSASRVRYANQIMDPELPNPPFFYGDETSQVEKTKHYRGKLTTRRILRIVALAILVIAMTAVAVSAARYIFYNATFKPGEGLDQIIWGESEEEPVYYSDFEIGYIPDGYELLSKEVDEFGYMVEYVNANEEYISIIIAYRDSLASYVDNEYFIKEEIYFDEYQGYYFYSEYHELSMLIWTDGTYEYLVQTPRNKEQIIEIARNISGVK